MHRIRDAWQRWTATRYTRLLEAENARLRAENRALLNSILGIAGIPPITVAAPNCAASEQEGACGKRLRGASEREGICATGLGLSSAVGTGTSPGGEQVATPVRRRSWHQINRALEIDSARKKEQSAGNTGHLPAEKQLRA